MLSLSPSTTTLARERKGLCNTCVILVGGPQSKKELYVYDIALRIGAKLGVFPEKVYLHAGTRMGATALRIASLPRALRRLKPHEVEDVLCIFKDRFGATVRGVRRSWCG